MDGYSDKRTLRIWKEQALNWIGALDRRILHIHWTDFVSNDVVRSRTDTIRRRRLSFFGHLCRSDTSQDHSRALQACFWRRRSGRPRQTWLRTVEDDLRPLYFNQATAMWCTLDRLTWRQLTEAAMAIRDMLWRERSLWQLQRRSPRINGVQTIGVTLLFPGLWRLVSRRRDVGGVKLSLYCG